MDLSDICPRWNPVDPRASSALNVLAVRLRRKRGTGGMKHYECMVNSKDFPWKKSAWSFWVGNIMTLLFGGKNLAKQSTKKNHALAKQKKRITKQNKAPNNHNNVQQLIKHTQNRHQVPQGRPDLKPSAWCHSSRPIWGPSQGVETLLNPCSLGHWPVFLPSKNRPQKMAPKISGISGSRHGILAHKNPILNLQLRPPWEAEILQLQRFRSEDSIEDL